MKVLLFSDNSVWDDRYNPIFKQLIETRKDLFEVNPICDNTGKRHYSSKEEFEETKHYLEVYEDYLLDNICGVYICYFIHEKSDKIYYITDDKKFRTDPFVVELFEALGYEPENDFYIAEIPDDMEWILDYSSGWCTEFESVVEVHREFNFDYRSER